MCHSVFQSSNGYVRLGTAFWIVVSGGLLLGTSFFAESLLKYFDRLTVQQYLFRLDFRYWPPGLTYPLWLIFTLLLVDAIFFRNPSVDHTEFSQRIQKFERAAFIVKMGLAVLIVYFFLNVCIITHGYWLWWYVSGIFLLALFLIKWLQIYKMRKRTDFMPEILNVRKQFLMMSITLTTEVLIFVFLIVTGLMRHLSYPLWMWFGYGSYSHIGGLAFLLLCIAIVLTIYAVQRWCIATLAATQP